MGKASRKKQPQVAPVTEVRAAGKLSGSQIAVLVVILVAVLAVYARVIDYKFISQDDSQYVVENKHVAMGLSGESVRWALTATDCYNWHPLTWLSLMTDYQIGGLHPRVFHITSILLHVINTALLVLLLTRMTGSFWRSAFVGALFGLHPVHVESVAWISERKDVLSTVFLLLTIFAYDSYYRKPGARAYVLVAAALAAGLCAKPMLVSLPVVLLLLDYWPLRRLGSDLAARVREKLPLFALAGLACVITVIAQRAGGAVATTDAFPVGMRLSNAVTSYVSYIIKLVWPVGLSFFYPHPGAGIPAWQTLCCAVVLAAITYAAFRAARSRPYFIVGWLWYLVTLLPVIGLVQVGSQGLADRYTYVPWIGLFVIVAWGVPDLLEALCGRRVIMGRVMAGAAVLAVIVLSASSWVYAGYWRDDYTIWTRAKQVTRDNWSAYYNLGCLYGERKQYDKALSSLAESLKIKPEFADANTNYGTLLMDMGRVDEALPYLQKGSDLAPADATALANYGHALHLTGDARRAVGLLKRALEIAPDNASARNFLGMALSASGDSSEAADTYRKAIEANPKDAYAHNNYGTVLAGQGKTQEAMGYYLKAVKLDPKFAQAYCNLAEVAPALGKPDEAESYLRKAISVDPKCEAAYFKLGQLLQSIGRTDEAVEQFKEVLKLNPRQRFAHEILGVICARAGRLEEAKEHFSEVVRLNPNDTQARNNLNLLLKQMGKGR